MNARRLLVALAVLSTACGSASASYFAFDCPQNRYVSVAVGQHHLFRAPIRGLQTGGHAVEVTFQPHLPEGWFAQWRQQSSGQWNFESQQIVLQSGLSDEIQIDIFPDASAAGRGWVDLTIRSVEDPLEVARCTFTLFSGQPVPSVDFRIECYDNARWLDQSQYFEFHSPLVNELPRTDTLMVSLFTDLVDGWDMHFCHGGICNISYAEFPIYSGAPDSIVIMCYVGEVPGASAADMILQSKSNPSLAQYCSYRAYLQQPQGAESPAATSPGAGIALVPNPSSGEMAFRLSPAALAEGGALAIFRADGRVVRELPPVDAGLASARVAWDGRDAAGQPVPPGIYFYRWRSGGSIQRGTIVRTR